MDALVKKGQIIFQQAFLVLMILLMVGGRFG